VIAVQEIFRWPAVVTEQCVIHVIGGIEFVAELTRTIDGVDILAIIHQLRIEAEEHILALLRIEHTVTVAALPDVVPSTILRLINDPRRNGNSKEQLLILLEVPCAYLRRRRDLVSDTFKFIARLLLVENLILRLTAVDAEEEIATRLAVPNPTRHVTPLAVIGVTHIVTLIAIHTFVAELAVVDEETIHAVTAPEGARRVVAMLRVHGSVNEIAVLHEAHMVAVLAVLGIRGGEKEVRDDSLENSELREERSGGVEGKAERQRLPPIAPVARVAEHRTGGICGIERENTPLATAARPSVERPFIPVCEAALLPAIRA